jgi:hypothetical protein
MMTIFITLIQIYNWRNKFGTCFKILISSFQQYESRRLYPKLNYKVESTQTYLILKKCKSKIRLTYRSYLPNLPMMPGNMKPSHSITASRSFLFKIPLFKKVPVPSLSVSAAFKTPIALSASLTSLSTCSSWALRSTQFTMSTRPLSIKIQAWTMRTRLMFKQITIFKFPTKPFTKQ